jgi:hypothetical protein
MITPGVLNLTIYQGATFQKTLKWITNTVDPVTHEVIKVSKDLTGYTAKMQIREFVESDEVLIELSTENGRLTIETLPDGDSGINMFIDAEDTASLNFMNAVYDLKIISSGGYVYRIVAGSVELSKEITREFND